jgi:hypothetical protein
MALFESYERRIDQINAALAKYDIKSIEEAKAICDEKGINVYDIVKSTQPICFENACWAYTVGAAMAIKNGEKMLLKQSVLDYNHSVFQDLLLMIVK